MVEVVATVVVNEVVKDLVVVLTDEVVSMRVEMAVSVEVTVVGGRFWSEFT